MRHVSLTLSVLSAQRQDDRYVASVRVLRALPRAVVRRLARAPGTVGALAGAVAAPGAASRERLAAGTSTGAGARRAARAALALHDVDAAHRAWEAARAAGVHDVVLEARVLAARGEVTRGLKTLGGVPGRRARQVRDLLEGELAVLRPAPAEAVARARAGGVVDPDGPVLHVVTNALPETQAGYTVRTQGIAAAQVRAGTRAVVLPRLGFPVTSGAVGAPSHVTVDGVESVRTLPSSLPARADARLAADVDALTRHVRALRPRVLHAHSSYPNARVALGARARTGVPVVYEVRGFLEETWRSRGGSADSDRYRLARESETQAMLAADHVVTISEGMAADIRGRGVPAEKVTVVPNSVDDAFLAPAPDPTDLRHGLGVAPADVVVGIVTTLNAYEGVDVLVDAVGRLQDVGAAGGAVHLLVVGDGPERQRLTEQAAQVVAPGRAHVVGKVPYARVREYFAAIDVFVVPRLDLPVTARVTPIKPLESMATGRPVVASDLAPLREIVQEGRTGWFARPGDADDLARVLRDVAGDPDARRAAGARAREWVRAERTWGHAAETYDRVYRSLG